MKGDGTLIDYGELFLERADWLKYQLYVVLSRPYVKDVTITDLAVMMNSKYQPTYNIFQELLDDLVDLSGEPRENVRTAMLAGVDLPLSLDAYRANLVQNSLVYRLVDYVIKSPSPSASQFCDQEFVSRSTISRKLKPLNALLKQYGLKFKLAKFAFDGNEINIRYFLFTMYWWAYRGTTWPFASVDRKQLEEEFEAITIVPDRPLTHLQQLYFLAIGHLRVGKQAGSSRLSACNCWMARSIATICAMVAFDHRSPLLMLRRLTFSKSVNRALMSARDVQNLQRLKWI